MVGASDTHTGAISDDEADYHSKIGILDGTPQGRGSVPLPDEQVQLIMDNDDLPGARLIGLKKFGDSYYSNPGFRQWSASGLAVVWAEENTRDSIFNAFRRKETYATSGNRIKLRFFAGEDLDDTPLSDEGLINKAYTKGVPMGGELQRAHRPHVRRTVRVRPIAAAPDALPAVQGQRSVRHRQRLGAGLLAVRAGLVSLRGHGAGMLRDVHGDHRYERCLLDLSCS